MCTGRDKLEFNIFELSAVLEGKRNKINRDDQNFVVHYVIKLISLILKVSCYWLTFIITTYVSHYFKKIIVA